MTQLFYEKLKELVDTEKLLINCVIGNPRTRSNAVYHAMITDRKIDGGVLEPFSTSDREGIRYDFIQGERKIRGFDEVCEKIYEIVVKILKNKANATIWLHDLFYEILDEELHLLLTLTNNILICVRNPQKQVLSFLIRVANDRLATDRKCDLNREDVIKLFSKMKKNVSPTEIFNYVKKEKIKISKSQILKTINKKEFEIDFPKALLTAMESVLQYVQKEMQVVLQNTKKHLSTLYEYKKMGKTNFVIIDTDELVKHPENFLTQIATTLSNITFCKEMIEDWGFQKNEKISKSWIIQNTNTPEDNAWNGPATKSTSFTFENDASGKELLEVNQFHDSLQLVLNDLIILYNYCLTRPEVILNKL